MHILKQAWVLVIGVVLVALVVYLSLFRAPLEPRRELAPDYQEKMWDRTDHSAYFTRPFDDPRDVTKACLECHQEASLEVMATRHWSWLGPESEVPGHEGKQRIGKRNLINNFCIGVQGNWKSCTQCHAGYGWADDTFDFEDPSRVDCLVCHDNSGTYLKGPAGMPGKGVDLQTVAKSVGFPKRDNCGVCHHYGGGGLGVKHGDLDNTLDHPSRSDDVHMGGQGFRCIDCHASQNHNIKGRSMSVSVDNTNGVGCTDCHSQPAHRDQRINAHLDAVACQTCHIPTFARRVPTKMVWDWSKAGDRERPDDVYHYLSIKGEFVYGTGIVPEYRWFNGTSWRYLIGDRIPEEGVALINNPLGDVNDETAKIWPFKVHRAKQPYDTVHRTIVPPRTSGEGGYWHEFNWEKAVKMGSEAVGLPYSGEFGFVETLMYWPLSHMVAPKEQALSCDACHGSSGRMDWRALGYAQDPLVGGGRP